MREVTSSNRVNMSTMVAERVAAAAVESATTVKKDRTLFVTPDALCCHDRFE